MKAFVSIAAVLFFAFAPPAGAKPASWYKWRSVSGDTVCAQTSPGPGWVRLETAYVDPRCQRRDRRADDDARTRNRK